MNNLITVRDFAFIVRTIHLFQVSPKRLPTVATAPNLETIAVGYLETQLLSYPFTSLPER